MRLDIRGHHSAGAVVLAALLATAAMDPAVAAENAALTTEDLVRMALSHNPELEARRAGARALAARPEGLGSLAHPELSVGWMGERRGPAPYPEHHPVQPTRDIDSTGRAPRGTRGRDSARDHDRLPFRDERA